MSRFGNWRKEEGGGRVGGGGRLIHWLLVPAIVLLFSAEPTSSQTSNGALTAQKIPVHQYFVSLMETVTVSMQTISPEKPDAPVCLPYNNTLNNCTQSGNMYPILLDGQRTGSTQSCSSWPESQEYYIWNKDKQPRIILVIPHGWCTDYVTLVCCRNTAQRIYPPLLATITVYDTLGAVPQMVNSSYNTIGRDSSLAQVDLDRCRMEKYLELQVENPHSFHSALMYHFISEVEVYGRQGTTRDARVTRPNNPTLSSNSTHVDTQSNKGEGSDDVTVAVAVVLSVCVLFALVTTAVVVAGVAAVAKRIKNRQSDSDKKNDTEYASIEVFGQPDIQQNSNSTSNVIMMANPSYTHIQVASAGSKSTLTGGGRTEPREYETPVSTSASLQRDRSGYAFVLGDEDRCSAPHQYKTPVSTSTSLQKDGSGYAFVLGDEDRCSAPHQYQSSSTIGVPHHGEGARDHGYDYVGEVQPRICPSDCTPSESQNGHDATAYAISPVEPANEMPQHSPPAPSSPHRLSVYSYI